MGGIQILIINESTTLTETEVEVAIPALQRQITEHFEPAWGFGADLRLTDSPPADASGCWWLVIADDSDQANALGYHDLTDQHLPISMVFARTALQLGASWTVTASHELLEMLADPGINLTAFDLTSFEQTQNPVGRLYAYEVCDPCQADADGYEIDGVLVSDFVYPAWFEPFWPESSTRFDQSGLISAPLALRPSGFISVYDLTSGTGWHQLEGPAALTTTAATRPLRAPVGSRRERRRTPRERWRRSRPSAHGRST